jgi:hypothetical protein
MNQQAKNFCETFKSELLDTCGKTMTFEGTKYNTVNECQQALQTKIDTCINQQKTENQKTCDALKSSNSSESTSTTTAPKIPEIKTLVRPDAPDVSQISPYLSGTFLPRVARTVVSFGIGASVIGLILGAIGMLTAYGNDEKYGNAKKGVYFSIIGLIICLLSFAIVQLIFFTGFQAGQIK